MTRLLPSSYATGNQQPTSLVVPEYVSNDVLDTLDLLSEAGFECMDWQALLLECWMGVKPDGRWAAPSCGNEAPRQNGKTRVMCGRSASEMLFYDGTVIYTAQLQKTSTETFEEMAELFDTKALRKFLAPNGIRTALGREEIRLKSGARMKFLARTRNGGNGQHGSLLIFDEAQYLDKQAQGSFLAAISACKTRRGPQTIYNGNAPEDGDNSVVFERIRADALSGKTKRTAWTEWSCGAGLELPDVSDRSMWERTNPSLGVLISMDTVEAEYESEDPEQFAHQRLGWFATKAATDHLISHESWDAATVDDPPEGFDKLAYGVRFTPDGRSVSLAAAATVGGSCHIEFMRTEPTATGIGWLVDWLMARRDRAAAVAIDGRADATDLAQQLIAAGMPKQAVMVARTNDAITADAMLVNAINDSTLTHLEDPALAESAMGATRRPIGKDGGYGFGGECPERLDACALALWAARTTKRDPKRRGRIG